MAAGRAESGSASDLHSAIELLNIKDDTSRASCEIHASPEDMRKQMVEIVQYSSTRTHAQDWFAKMRFLIISHTNSRVEDSISLNDRSLDTGTIIPLPTSARPSLKLELRDGYRRLHNSLPILQFRTRGTGNMLIGLLS